MRRTVFYRQALTCLVTLHFIVPPVSARSLALIESEKAEAIYKRLVEAHWIPQTGLFRSFPDTGDQKLSQQASTYEQAAMGLLALRFGDKERAGQLLHFFRDAWAKGPDLPGPRHGYRGLANFYNAYFGSEGIEKTIHTGPNAWVGLFAARFANQQKDKDALQLALDIQYWLQNVLPHQRGGIAMGLRNDPYGAAWSSIFSTENNLSYYAFLTELLRNPSLDKGKRAHITQERDGVEAWIVQVAYDAKAKTILRGTNNQGRDETRALDTITWLISAIGPRRLEERGIAVHDLLESAARDYEVTVGGRQGVDAADHTEADRVYADLRNQLHEINRPGQDGHRVIWYEGLGQYIITLCTMASYSSNTGDRARARAYIEKASALTASFDDAMLKRPGDAPAYAYATPGKFFRYGWGAPAEGDNGPAASLIAGAWRVFAGLGLDPLTGRDVGTVRSVQVKVPTSFELAPRRQVVLYGTSEDMTTEAWRALKEGELDHAQAQARATIEEWSNAAQFLQKMKQSEVGGLVEYSGQPNEKSKVFKYWALNDVGAAYFILGQALHEKSDYNGAAQAFAQVVKHYSLAQIWDPGGWFWSPMQAINENYVLQDRKHYGWVMPQAFAEGSRTGKAPF